MKAKNILKKDVQKFCKDAAELFTRLGFEPFPPDVPPYDLHGRDLRIQTDVGTFIVHPPHMETWFPSSLEDINGRFTEPARAAKLVDCNPYSGKWNILHSDVHVILAEFTRRMRKVNARPPSPDERKEWEAADAAEAAKLAAWRADMDEIVKRETATP